MRRHQRPPPPQAEVLDCNLSTVVAAFDLNSNLVIMVVLVLDPRMRAMRDLIPHSIPLLLLGIALTLAGCTSAPPSPSDTAPLALLSLTAPPAPPTRPPTRSVPTKTSTPVPAGTITFSVVYNNLPHDPALVDAWGFSCLVETGGGTVLFDTGGEGPILMGNIAALGIDPVGIDAVVLSHIHGDHVGGLESFLTAADHDPPVYVPAAFPAVFKEQVGARTELVEVTGPLEILPGIHSTGELGRSIVEQGMIVETGEGMVIVTGCAHPGVVEMVRRAREVLDGDIALVMGGFHLGQASYSRIEDIIRDFRAMGVRLVAPSHCTGDLALGQIREAYGADFVRGYLGDVITMAAPGR